MESKKFDPEKGVNQDIERQLSHSDSSIHGQEQDSPTVETLYQTRSHVSATEIATADTAYREVGDEVYDRFSRPRKRVVVAVLSYCAFLSPISSTTVLSAVPEVAKQFQTTGSIINLTNALYLVAMGLSPMFWGPISQVFGRRWPCIFSLILFTAFSIGTALSPNLASFFVFRVLTAFQGTSMLIIGSSCIGDMYKPVERGTALGWFLSGALIGPALGPLIGGVIVTYRSWRVIFWLQSALAGCGLVLVSLVLPETLAYKRSVELVGLTKTKQASKIWTWTNPVRVLRLYRYPNILIVGLASSSLLWNMYSFLTPIRYVLNPRFGLSTPLQSGLFYLVPGSGYLLGTFFGGRWADTVVKRYITKRGRRIPEDRLRSALPFMGIVIPICMLIYGWSVEKRAGGVALPVIAMFVQGVAQLFCFPSLNTYCLDVNQRRSGEVVAGNYAIRYLFGALGTAVVLPAIEKIGVGWFSTISALLLVLSTASVYVTAVFGRGWREAIDERKAAREAEKTATEAREHQ
jgi:multidrug resistance protein